MPLSDTLKKILIILADGDFHSGTELARHLEMSRSAVAKQLHGLSELGLDLIAIHGKGYKLVKPLQLLSKQAIEDQLLEPTSSTIDVLEIHDCIHSTNAYLQEKAFVVENRTIVCLAEYQQAGKGRRGRTWVSPFGSNIYLSVLKHFYNGPACISGLSLAVGVAVIRVLNKTGVENAGLKWPNDIYWQGKKLGGILIEVGGETEGPCHAVIGLGLNGYLPAKQAQSIEQPWVDLDSIMEQPFHGIRNQLAAELINQILRVVNDFESTGLSPYINEWRQYDCMKGMPADLFMGDQVFRGIVEGIDEQGMILLKDDAGNIRPFASGEVSFRKT